MKKIIVLLMALVLAPAAMAQSADWQKKWDETLAAAKKEGKVVVLGSPDPVMRNDVIPAFQKRYGITVEYIAVGSSGQASARIRTERQSGIYSVDVFMSGLGTTVNIYYPEKMIDPLKPLLILPEVTDGAKWKRGKPWFIDPEQEYILMLFANVDSHFYVNTDYVKPEEVRAINDLLNPKFAGKISTEEPTSSGTGANTAGHILRELGPDFTRKLYIDQKPGVSRERRQLTDWLARGTYPICLTCRTDDIRQLLKDGFKITEVFELSDLKNRLNPRPSSSLTPTRRRIRTPRASSSTGWRERKRSRCIRAAMNRRRCAPMSTNPFLIPRPCRARACPTWTTPSSTGSPRSAWRPRTMCAPCSARNSVTEKR